MTEPLNCPDCKRGPSFCDCVCTCGCPREEHISDGQCTVLTESHRVNPSMTISAVCPCLKFERSTC